MAKSSLTIRSTRNMTLCAAALAAISGLGAAPARGQAATTYTARTDRAVIPITPMDPPAVNVVFQDPDFGSQMVRVTDENTRPNSVGKFYRNSSSGNASEWSADGTKFYVMVQNGPMTFFSFDPVSMLTARIKDAPFVGEGEFSAVDPDLIYGVRSSAPYVIQSYRFSTGVVTPVLDTSACGMQPALNPKGTSLSLIASSGDARLAMIEGGTTAGRHMFVVVYDAALGCEWYNTQTGQVGGQWGPAGTVSTTATFTMRGAFLSRDGNSVFILPNSGTLTYIWQVGTQTVTACTYHCGGYEAIGSSRMVNSSGYLDDMNVWARPLNNQMSVTPLVVPLKTPNSFGMVQRWAWTNVDANDSVPACGTTFRYDTYDTVTTVWDNEIVCLETDGVASTVWRFAHTRTAVEKIYFNSEPLGNISPDGRYFLFTSDWDETLGEEADGTPRSDVWIVKLE